MRSRILMPLLVALMAVSWRSAGQELSYSTEHIDILFSNIQNQELIARSIDNINADLIFVLRELQSTENSIARYSVLFEGDCRQMYFFLSMLSSFADETSNPGAAVICGVRVEKNISQLPSLGEYVIVFESDDSHFSTVRKGVVRRILKAFEKYCDDLGVNYTD